MKTFNFIVGKQYFSLLLFILTSFYYARATGSPEYLKGGDTLKLTLKNYKEGKIQWQYNNPDSNSYWYDITDKTSEILIVSVPNKNGNAKYRAKIVNNECISYSEVFWVSMEYMEIMSPVTVERSVNLQNSVSITSVESNVSTVCNGGSAFMQVNVLSFGDYTLQWLYQKSTDEEVKWQYIQGENSKTLNLENIQRKNNGDRYIC
ncbi:MAG: hypothetical protein SNJ71_01535, partial [Bacteroidales bacterium]